MERLKFLFDRYKNAEATPEETGELLDIFMEVEKSSVLMEEIEGVFEDGFEDNVELGLSVDEVYHNLRRDIFAGAGEKKKAGILKLGWIKAFAAAATITVVAGLGYLYLTRNNSVSEEVSVYANDIEAGSNKALLKLADGKTISLSGDKKGVVIDASRFSYNDGSAVAEVQTEKIQMLSMETPRGGQYEATLPDGTHVWLNAASEIRFPSKFTGNNRTVELSGEAYFEVSHDRSKPFRVVSRGQQIEVLGTHFNINTYADEPSTKTTLLEGSVRVVSGSSSDAGSSEPDGAVVLKPGEQSVLRNNTIKVSKVDADDAVAWKNGLFVFQDEPLESIMRRVARWYDVEVVYQGADKNKQFFGGVSRFDNISSLLQMLESTKGVHFKVEGRRLTVMK